MSPKQKAIEDIKLDLKSSEKCFIAFVQSLNPIMEKIVNYYLEEQENLSK